MIPADHDCAGVDLSAAGEWRVRCWCGWASNWQWKHYDAVNAYARHVIGFVAIEQPPVEVVEDARRAFRRTRERIRNREH